MQSRLFGVLDAKLLSRVREYEEPERDRGLCDSLLDGRLLSRLQQQMY